MIESEAKNHEADAIARICQALTCGGVKDAASIARTEIPFQPKPIVKRAFTRVEALQVFVRDGFLDRYTGDRLVFPGTLILLSNLLPDEIPYHPNWKTDECHEVYWRLYPTVDHVVPVSRGGADAVENWVTTSQITNSATASWTLEELGWTLKPPGNADDWDGLFPWFMDYVEAHSDVLVRSRVKNWHVAGVRVRERA